MSAADTQSSFDLPLLQLEEHNFLVELFFSLRMAKSKKVNDWFSLDEDPIDPKGLVGKTSRTIFPVCSFTGVECDHQDLVTTLDLSSMGLSGTLPSSFAPLSQLRRLLLRNNRIEGPLPQSLPANLVHFNVDFNHLQGPVPPSFGFSVADDPVPKRLERLILSGNMLSGTIPQELCNLEKLRALNLSRNKHIAGTLPSCLGSLSDLQGLQVHLTSVVGPVPEDICPMAGTHFSENNSSSISEGWCARWEFCLDGYYDSGKETSTPQVESHAHCLPCQEESNIVASPLCRWVSMDQMETPSDVPSSSPWSGFPSSLPSMIPSSPSPTKPSLVSPSTAPSDVPSALPTGQLTMSHSGTPSLPPSPIPSIATSSTPSNELSAVPSLSPTATPSTAPSIPLSTAPSTTYHGNDQTMSSPPSLADVATSTPTQSGSLDVSEMPTGTGVNGVEDGLRTTSGASTLPRSRLIRALVPVLVLCFVLGASHLYIISIRYSLRGQRHLFLTLSNSSGNSEHTTSGDKHDEPQELPTTNSADGAPTGQNPLPVQQKIQTTSAPTRCSRLVKPETLAANPTVRFLLLDDIENSMPPTFPSASPETLHTGVGPPTTTVPSLAQTAANIFRDACASATPCNTAYHPTSREEIEWADSLEPATVFLSHDSSSCHSLEECSTASSAVPLNPFVNVVSSKERQAQSSVPGMSQQQVVEPISNTTRQDHAQRMVTSTNTSRMCSNLHTPGKVPRSDSFLENRDDTHSLRHAYDGNLAYTESDKTAVLGIRSQWQSGQERSCQDCEVEVAKMYAPERRWFEATDLEV